MAKATSKEILIRVKEKAEAEERGNVTFRINKGLTMKFKAKCEQEGVSMAAVLEEMLSDFVKR